MPIYEYRCSRCGHELEALQKITDAPLSACPACRESALVKKVSAAGFQLKGSGWYATDFRSSGSKPAANKEGATSDQEGAKSDAAKVDSAKAEPAKTEPAKADSPGTTGKAPSESKSESKPASSTSTANS